MIKIEVVEGDKFNSLIITPRDNDDATRREMDLILHAIMTQSPKRGGFGIGPNGEVLKIDVVNADIVTEISDKLIGTA